MQRTTFLVSHLQQREEKVKAEMERFTELMERLVAALHEEHGDRTEEFALDCHDLSLENVFVDPNDVTKIVSNLLGKSLQHKLTLPFFRHASSIGSLRLPDHYGHQRTFLHSSKHPPSQQNSSELQSKSCQSGRTA